jgi:choline-sulfatase
MFGAVLERLAAVGQNPDDWIIVFTSDHGDMLGQHGLWMKTKFFEGSARVPLMIRWPEKFTPRRVSENVSQCDLFKTLCELCGLETPGGLDSRSLTGLMSGDESGWNNEAVSQFGKNVMIKQGDLKYQYYGEEHPELLFDLAANPEETGDFLNDPAYAAQLAGFRKRLGELGSGPDADPDYLNAGYCG